MDSKIIAGGILRAVAVVCAFAALLYFLCQIQSVLIYIVIAFVLSLIGRPVMEFLQNRLRFNNTFATIFTLIFFIGIITGFMLLFIPLILAQGENLSLLNSGAIEQDLTVLLNKISLYLEKHGVDGQQMLQDLRNSTRLDVSAIPNFLNQLLGTVTDFSIAFASVLFITFFFLKDRDLIRAGARKLIPDQHEDKILNTLQKINRLLSRYFIGLLLQLSIVSTLYLTVLLIFHVQNAFVIAFLCGILNIVPYVGPLIASFSAAIMTMLSNLGHDFQTQILPVSIYVLIGFWIVHLIDNNLSQPIIFSKSVSSHPLEIFLIIIMAGFLFGIVGMIIAVPSYTILKVFLKEFFPENKLVQLLTKKI